MNLTKTLWILPALLWSIVAQAASPVYPAGTNVDNTFFGANDFKKTPTVNGTPVVTNAITQAQADARYDAVNAAFNATNLWPWLILSDPLNAAHDSTNGFPWGPLYDPSGSAFNSTNGWPWMSLVPNTNGFVGPGVTNGLASQSYANTAATNAAAAITNNGLSGSLITGAVGSATNVVAGGGSTNNAGSGFVFEWSTNAWAVLSNGVVVATMLTNGTFIVGPNTLVVTNGQVSIGGLIAMPKSGYNTVNISNMSGAFCIDSGQSAQFRMLPNANDIYFQNTVSSGNIYFCGLNAASLSGDLLFRVTGNVKFGASGSEKVTFSSAGNVTSLGSGSFSGTLTATNGIMSVTNTSVVSISGTNVTVDMSKGNCGWFTCDTMTNAYVVATNSGPANRTTIYAYRGTNANATLTLNTNWSQPLVYGQILTMPTNSYYSMMIIEFTGDPLSGNTNTFSQSLKP